jgi:multidrug efflux pump subunit AcrA (membrane-fusion protein)
MRARTIGIGAATMATVAAAGVAGAAIAGRGGAAATTNPPAVATATVTRTDLSTTEHLSGTLQYTGSHPVTSMAHGTLTALAAEGSTVTRGQTLYEVDASPVRLLYGSRPAWRTLTAGISGPDVSQLDENLVALGYATRGQLGSGDTFTAAETAAVKRWQSALGIDQTGTIPLGSIVFLPGAIRIGAHAVEPGAEVNPGMTVTAASDTTRTVDVSLDASKQALVKVGDAVSVDLPTGDTVAGRVGDIARVARSSGSGGNGGSGGGSPTIDVTVTLADQSHLGSLDAAPVDVVVTTQSVQGVLAVPITALTVLPGGGYAVDVVQGGVRHRVPVTTGLFSDTLVQVDGQGLHEGSSVEVPSL